MKRHRRDFEMMTEMNLTNLLDTAFVLLIAFIIAAPSVRNGLSVDLPEVQDAPSLPDSKEKTMEIVVQRTPPGMTGEWIYVGEQRVTLQELSEKIQASKLLNPKLTVSVSADKEATYDSFAKVLGVVRNNQIENVGLPIDPLNPEAEAQKKAEVTPKTPAK